MLATVLKVLLPFCGGTTPEVNRVSLSGICMEFLPAGIRLIASDGHMGLVVEVKVLHGNSDGDTLVVHQEEIKRIIKYLEMSHGEPTLAAVSSELWIMCDDSNERFLAMDCKYMNWRNGFQLDKIKLEADACYFNTSYLEQICKTFKRLSEKPFTTIYQPCGALNRAILSIPTDRLKPGLLSAKAVIMPMRP